MSSLIMLEQWGEKWCVALDKGGEEEPRHGAGVSISLTFSTFPFLPFIFSIQVIFYSILAFGSEESDKLPQL